MKTTGSSYMQQPYVAFPCPLPPRALSCSTIMYNQPGTQRHPTSTALSSGLQGKQLREGYGGYPSTPHERPRPLNTFGESETNDAADISCASSMASGDIRTRDGSFRRVSGCKCSLYTRTSRRTYLSLSRPPMVPLAPLQSTLSRPEVTCITGTRDE
jgi:hypothetical protein